MTPDHIPHLTGDRTVGSRAFEEALAILADMRKPLADLTGRMDEELRCLGLAETGEGRDDGGTNR